MLRNQKLRQKRINFIKLAVKDKKKAAKQLRLMAKGLENTKNFSDTIYALTQIFGISERTIFRDLQTD